MTNMSFNCVTVTMNGMDFDLIVDGTKFLAQNCIDPCFCKLVLYENCELLIHAT